MDHNNISNNNKEMFVHIPDHHQHGGGNNGRDNDGGGIANAAVASTNDLHYLNVDFSKNTLLDNAIPGTWLLIKLLPVHLFWRQQF